MNNSEPAKPRFTLSFGRVALLLAALIAVVAVGITQYRKYKSANPEPTADSSAPAGPVADVASMIASLEKRLQSNPDDAEGWNMLGWSYYSTGRYADAATAYGRAIKIDPRNATYWSALGEVEVLAGPGGITPKAVEAFGKALAIDPKDFRARYFMGVKKDQDGKHQEAIDDWIALVKEAPAGAPWEDAVRDLIAKASKEHNIDVAGRVPPKRIAPMADVGGGMGGMPVTGSGAQVATDGIPGPSAGDMQAAAGMTTGQQNEMIAGMVGKLEARLASNPRDSKGWIFLMRARMVLNEPDKARKALADGKAAFAGDKAEQARIDEAAKALGVQ
ncbi:tetratricopeptide repeat protein [Sphingomonas montanisoli]|uniref:Tetratricopeptide repeat protein n=1 Tax=Sphingomonas montanisoli TaxID=2606412 RepID=A0A5D9BZ74_9SPHN|nr:tetratricopeptide repeat protein [Sphingomonas montanisoli]TZG24739.1 tetratricopeptide repeat protein [Sphingomonas montanisoli]